MILSINLHLLIILLLLLHTHCQPSNASEKIEPNIQIFSPKEGVHIIQEQDTVLIKGKVIARNMPTPLVDVLFILDVSASTSRYAGVNFSDVDLISVPSRRTHFGGQTDTYSSGIGSGQTIMEDLRNSILAAEVAGTRRLLSQLNPQTTRVGLVTFGDKAYLLQPLTHNFEKVKISLENILATGPYGGTHMVGGIRRGIRELSGLGVSRKRSNVIKVNFLLTDGYPTLPIGAGKKATIEDANLAINAGRIAGKAGIKIHVFALGNDALSTPRAAAEIARQSGGIFTPVVRPADILKILESVSLVGVEHVVVLNKTTGKRSSGLRLAPDGLFSSSVPVIEGVNKIEVLARVSGGYTARNSVTVYYQREGKMSLDLEVFLEKERSLKLEVEQLGKSTEKIKRQIHKRLEKH